MVSKEYSSLFKRKYESQSRAVLYFSRRGRGEVGVQNGEGFQKLTKGKKKKLRKNREGFQEGWGNFFKILKEYTPLPVDQQNEIYKGRI